jgi:virginiamycin B lyase
VPSFAPTAGETTAAASATPAGSQAATLSVTEFPVPAGSHPHDVAPARDGGIWYTAQGAGKLGWLDPATGKVEEIPLGAGSAPHGVIVGPDGAPWITDGGLNAIVRVDPATHDVRRFPLPPGTPKANLNTAAFGAGGVLWFTGQAGYVGTLYPSSGSPDVQEAPRGVGPYGITSTPSGTVYFASLAGSYLGAVDPETGGVADVFEPPTAKAGVRRAWSDSQGRIWISEWNVGQVGVFDPKALSWREWKLPGDQPMAYAVFVDDHDVVWLTDFGADAIVRFDPASETFTTVALPTHPAEVRQLLGRPGELWGAESAADKLVVVRTAS